jgi:hypothetical protein
VNYMLYQGVRDERGDEGVRWMVPNFSPTVTTNVPEWSALDPPLQRNARAAF